MQHECYRFKTLLNKGGGGPSFSTQVSLCIKTPLLCHHNLITSALIHGCFSKGSGPKHSFFLMSLQSSSFKCSGSFRWSMFCFLSLQPTRFLAKPVFLNQSSDCLAGELMYGMSGGSRGPVWETLGCIILWHFSVGAHSRLFSIAYNTVFSFCKSTTLWCASHACWRQVITWAWEATSEVATSSLQV